MSTPVEIHVDVAPEADLTAGPLSWPWERLHEFTHLGKTKKRLLKASDLSIASGTAGESALPNPSSVQWTVDNSDGAFTPGLPTSSYYGRLGLDTPCRIRVPGSTTALVTDGDLANFASTVHHSSLAITGDIDLRYFGDIDWWAPAPSPALVGRYKATGNNRSYLLWILNGFPMLAWSTAGTAVSAIGVASTLPVPWAKGLHGLRATLDVSNAGNHVVDFYTAAEPGGSWTLLDQVVSSGTTSIHAGTGALEVGAVTEEASRPPVGRTHSAEVRNGINGTVVAAPDFSAQVTEATGFTDSAGRAWTVQGDAEITSLRTRRMFQISEIAPYWLQQNPDDTVIARADITAAGVLRRLQQGEAPLQSVLYRAETSPSVASNIIASWPMEDLSGATSFASPFQGVASAKFAGDVSLASDNELAASKPLPHVSGGEGFAWTAAVPRRTGITQWMVSHFVRVPTPSATEAELLSVTTTGSVRRWSISVTSTTLFVRAFDDDGSVVYSNSGGVAEFFDGWTQLSLRVTQDGGNVDFDFVYLTIGGSVIGGSNTVAGTAGVPTAVGALFVAPGADGLSFGHCTVSTGIGAGWLGWVDGANTGYLGEPAGRRVGRLCAEQGISCRLIGDPDDSEPMGPQRPLKFLDLLQECAAADSGILGEDAETLGLSFRTRRSLYNQTPALVLDRVQRGLTDPFTPTSDDRHRRTHITATRVDGSSATYVDPGFDETTDSVYEDDVTLNVETDGQLPDQAAWRVHLGTNTEMRYPSITTDLTIASDLVEDWLNLGYGDLVRVSNPPTGHPPGPVDLIVEQTVDDLSSFKWLGEINGTPASSYTVGVVEDEVFGRADTTGSELGATESQFDTSWSVVTTDGERWIDSATFPSMFPFDWMVAGERVTVTAITGASSPQTATVTRHVNGVIKAQTAGTPIRLADPLVLAL